MGGDTKMITLDEIALRYGTDKASNHHGYTLIYPQYFESLRDKPITLLEVGVQFGFSIMTWADYFHQGEIFGVDIVQDYQTANPHVHLFVGNAADPGFWNGFAPGWSWDIAIDDASHRASDQIETFRGVWPRLKPGGYYVIEDVQTWWDDDFNSFASGRAWLDELAGTVNLHGKSYHGKPRPLPDPQLTQLEKEIEFIHLYKGLVVIKKKT
jgi:hypothetical protein